jgi:hypothetical protein
VLHIFCIPFVISCSFRSWYRHCHAPLFP